MDTPTQSCTNTRCAGACALTERNRTPYVITGSAEPVLVRALSPPIGRRAMLCGVPRGDAAHGSSAARMFTRARRTTSDISRFARTKISRNRHADYLRVRPLYAIRKPEPFLYRAYWAIARSWHDHQ